MQRFHQSLVLVLVLTACGLDPDRTETDQALAKIDRRLANVEELQSQLAVLDAENTALADRVDVLEGALNNVVLLSNALVVAESAALPGHFDVTLTGNLHVVSGEGSTDALTNGFGNVIIGYNEDLENAAYDEDLLVDDKTGSHNLVVGHGHSYLSYGGIVAGKNNESSDWGAVAFGEDNIADGAAAVVTSGTQNRASGPFAAVHGGHYNDAQGKWSVVAGGGGPFLTDPGIAAGQLSVVVGGNGGWANGSNSIIVGGQHNTADGPMSATVGGKLSTANAIGEPSVVVGGFENTATGNFSVVIGGSYNLALGPQSISIGGNANQALNEGSTAVGSGSIANVDDGVQVRATAF